jgi:hypothetical protein
VLRDAGVLAQPRALLGAASDGEPLRVALLQDSLDSLMTVDYAVYLRRTEELAYLANTLVAGCSIQARAFTPQEASDAASAICNLGLAYWPPQWRDDAALPADFLLHHDLIVVFQVGWSVLHNDVCLRAAARLDAVLAELTCADRETAAGLRDLRLALRRHRGMPWLARDAFDVLGILDLPAWAALLALIAECPVLHAVIPTSGTVRPRSVDPSAFAFIESPRQVATIREYLHRLPETLRG